MECSAHCALQTLYFCWKTVDFLKSRKRNLMSRTCSEHIRYGVALTVTTPSDWMVQCCQHRRTHRNVEAFLYVRLCSGHSSQCIIYALWRQVGLVFALSRHVSVDPDSTSSHAGHSRVLQELLIHRVYTHTPTSTAFNLYTATSAKWLTLSQASTQVNPW